MAWKAGDRRVRDGRLETRTIAGTWVHSWHGRGEDPRAVRVREAAIARMEADGFSQVDAREEIARQERLGLLEVA